MGSKLLSALEARFGQHPNVGDVRGRGLFLGVELVADKETKQPFSSSLKLNADIKKRALAGGLMCYPMGGTLDGLEGDHVLLAPPYIIDDGHVNEIVDKLDAAINGALETAKAA
jgi:adenosylmethionine-8-amino-7-oxononanoate aminotransferase